MSINLTISLNQTGATAHRVRYARIDNVVNLSWITVSPDIINTPNLVSNIATNIDNGQYRIGYQAIYSDFRQCDEQFTETPACPGLISITAYIDGTNLIVQYLAPSQVPKVRITINYPNGGSNVANYVNNGNNIVIALPSNLSGTYLISGQSVCDESSAFYSAPSSQVSVERGIDNVSIVNLATGITITDVQGISGFALIQNVAAGNTGTGTHLAFFGGITSTFTGTPSSNSSASLLINSTIIQCVNIPNTNGGSFSFSAASFGANDNLTIQYNVGLCPSTPGGNIFIVNNTSALNDVAITNVTMGASVLVVGGYPINPGQQKGTTHAAFTGLISVQLTSVLTTGTRCMKIFINTIEVECVPISGNPNGIWNFSLRTYNLNDLIDIGVYDTAC